MADVTFMGHTADPEELRSVAAAADAGDPDLAERLAALPRCALSQATLASTPAVIAQRLREVAAFLERRRDGVPFGGPELQAALAHAEAENERRRREHPERYRDCRRRRA